MARQADRTAATADGDRDLHSIWRARLERANRLWGGLRKEIDPYYKSFENLWEGSAAEDANYIATPLAFTHVKLKLPRLTLQNPYVRVKARTPFSAPEPNPLQGIPVPVPAIGADGQTAAMVRDNIRAAEILEAAVNYELRVIGYKQQAKLCIQDAMFIYGVLKIGYHTEYTYEPAATAQEEAAEVAEGDNPRDGLEWNERIKRESVWVKRISPWDFRYDPDIKQLDPYLSEARWVAFRSVRLLEDVKRDPIYKNTRTLEATATNKTAAEMPMKGDEANRANERIPGQRVTSLSPNDKDLQEDYVVLWEVWDKKTRKVYVMAEGHDAFLREDDWPFDMDGPPFAFLYFHDVPDNRFPMSDFAPWFDQNELLNLVNSMDADAIKRRTNKFLFPKGAIEGGQLNKLEEPLNAQWVEVNNPEAIKELKTSTSGMDSAPYMQRLLYDIMQLSGLGENQRGAEGNAKTATESKIVEFNSQTRIAEEQDRVSDWANVSITKIIQVMQQLYTKQKLAPIIGREPQEWVPYTKDQIQGEYDIDIELMPYNPQRTELVVKQLTDLIALLSKIAPMGILSAGPMMGVPVNMAKLVEDLIRQMSPHLKPQDILGALQPNPIPSPAGGAPTPMGQQPPMMGGAPGMAAPNQGAPLPGEGKGANKRSMLASQGAGAAMTQGIREGGNLMAGASSPSRGY